MMDTTTTATTSTTETTAEATTTTTVTATATTTTTTIPPPDTDPPSTDKRQQYLEPSLYPPDGTMLETAAAAANHEDAVALAAMQEAATIVMEAQQRMQLEQPYTYAAANAVYGPSLSRTSRGLEGNKKRPSPENSEEDNDNENEPPKEKSPPKKRAMVPNRVSWEERLQQLKEYKEQHGNLLIPIRYKPSNLGKFVHNTREQFKLFHKQTPEGYKKKCSLTASRIRQLDELGFCWTTERTKRQNDDWQKRLQQLKNFRDKNGHCMVPHGYPEDPSFAEWIHRQRTSYNSLVKDEENGTSTATVNPMMRERFQQLKELGFNFTVHSDKWMDHWKQLKEYKEKHGDCQVPTHYMENQKLGRWVHTQRHQRRLQSKGKKS